MRHTEPDFVTAWMRGEVPSCCHTCLHYAEDGICRICGEQPPEEFARTIKGCESWKTNDGVPF